MNSPFSRNSLTTLNLELPSMSEVLANRRHAEEIRDQKKRRARRSYQAAKRTRLNSGLSVATTSPRTEIWRGLRPMRAGSRFLARNNDLMKRFLSMLRNNVAGPTGMQLQCTSPNPEMNTAVEAAWLAWSHPENASANGQLSWIAIQRKFISTLARDGEVLMRYVLADNPFGFALKFIDVNWLDEQYNERRPGGNRVIMSVELDDNDRPVAYWLTPPPDEFNVIPASQQRKRTRVDASEILHCFLRDDENSGDDTQTRGVPWGHTAFNTLYQLGVFGEAAIVAAVNGASRMGFLKRPADEVDPDSQNEGTEEDLPKVDHLEPGEIKYLPAGYEYQESEPAYPHPIYAPFTKAQKRDIASGLDVNYNSLANDGEGINFSTIRQFLLEDQRNYSALHFLMIECLERPVQLRWLKESILNRAVPLKPTDFKFFTEPSFVPTGFDWIDPLKDVQATILAIHYGLTTLTDEIAKRGGDITDNFTKREKELALAKQKNVPLPSTVDFSVTGGKEKDAKANTDDGEDD